MNFVMCGWNWPSGSGNDDEMWKVYTQTDERKDYGQQATRKTHLSWNHISIPGADPGILVKGGGGVDFFSKAWSLGAALRPPVRPGQRPDRGPWGEAPRSSWILVILGVKFNHIVSPHRWSYTLSKKKKSTFINTLSSENFFQSNLLAYHWAVNWVYPFVFRRFEPLLYTQLFSSRVTPLSQQMFLGGFFSRKYGIQLEIRAYFFGSRSIVSN